MNKHLLLIFLGVALIGCSIDEDAFDKNLYYECEINYEEDMNGLSNSTTGFIRIIQETSSQGETSLKGDIKLLRGELRDTSSIPCEDTGLDFYCIEDEEYNGYKVRRWFRVDKVTGYLKFIEFTRIEVNDSISSSYIDGNGECREISPSDS